MNENEIAEARRIRREISAEFDHDISAMIRYYRSFQNELKRTEKYHFEESTPKDLVNPERSSVDQIVAK